MISSSGRHQTSESELLDQLRELLRLQKGVMERLSRDQEQAFNIALRIEEAIDRLRVLHHGRPDRRSAPAFNTAKHELKHIQEQAAKKGVSVVRIERNGSGSALVSIDGSEKFHLTPILADLLEILCASDGDNPDSLIGWKKVEFVATSLSKMTGRSVTPHAVTQNVHRLRRQIYVRGKSNPYFVQTNRQQGVRFALRRRRPIRASEAP